MDFQTARRRARLSQRELAQLAGVSPPTVFKADHGASLRPKTQRKLAAALQLDPNELWPINAETPAPSQAGVPKSKGIPCPTTLHREQYHPPRMNTVTRMPTRVHSPMN